MPKTPAEIAAEAAAKAAADQAAAAVAAKAVSDAAHLAEHGFPLETPVADMTDAQQAAYWRAESKKQQKKVEGVDVAKLQADAAELAALKAANATPSEQAIEEARREGENLGAEKHLKTAVKAKFQLLTGKKDEDVETAFAHVDVLSFVNDQGDLDSESITKFAGTFGLKSTSATDPVRDAHSRQRPAGGEGSGQTMQERREAARDRMTKKKTPTT